MSTTQAIDQIFSNQEEDGIPGAAVAVLDRGDDLAQARLARPEFPGVPLMLDAKSA